jgi:hypothetical protein
VVVRRVARGSMYVDVCPVQGRTIDALT